MANKEEKLKAPVVGIGTQPQYAQQPQEEIPAANVQYEPNRKRRFTVTPEGAKYGIIDINGTVGHIQQDKRPAEVQNALFDLYQEFVPNKAIDRNDPNAVRRYVTQAYNTLHKENKVDDLYLNKGLIQYEQGDEQPAEPPKRKTTEELQKEAAETGKSFLQLYQENMAQPEYDEKRAKTLKTNTNASIIADILKLVGEGVTTKRGGTPITRQTIVPQLNAELQRLNDTYKQEVQAYKKGGFNALLMDEQEKRRSAALKAAREAAIQQIKIKADIEQRQREKQEQSELNKIKTQHELDMQRDKVNNEAKIKTANISASGRKNSGSKTDEFKLVDQYVNGKVVKVPIAIVNHVAAEERKTSIVNENKTENDLFNQHWNKYFDYVNGEFVPKGTAPATTTGATSRASSNNTQPKSRAK